MVDARSSGEGRFCRTMPMSSKGRVSNSAILKVMWQDVVSPVCEIDDCATKDNGDGD